MKYCVAIMGPTASGKSALALKLAQILNGEIISVDSMQLYCSMDIGTAKPTKEETEQVRHHMIDVLDAGEKFSVYDFKVLAEQAIDDCLQRGKLPILAGGTGLYFDALFYNINYGEFEIQEEIHNELCRRSENGENALLLVELGKVDPLTAAKLHEKDTKRIIRGLEVYLSTGKTLSQYQAESKVQLSDFHFIKFRLNFEQRDTLYQRINLRVDQMLENGLIKEAEGLYRSGALSSPTASQAIGYKEILPHITEGKPLEVCVDLLKQKTRNYAKRQLTWFRRYQDCFDLWMDHPENATEKAIEHIQQITKGEIN